jgi:hypothetical protein
VKKQYALVGLLLFCAPAAIAGSIFDDDWQDTHPARTPAADRPAPAATPRKPQPAQQPPQQPTDRPAPTRIVAPTPEPESVPDTAPPPGAQDRRELARVAAHARAAVNDAIRAADEYMQSAQHEIDALLASNADYQRAKADMEQTRDRLNDVRLEGTAQEKLNASAAYTAAVAREKRIRESTIAGSESLKEAKQLAAALAPARAPALASAAPAGPGAAGSTGASAVPAGKGTDERTKDINIAIAQRNLLEGMTYEEACRAARSAPQLMSNAGTTKVYRWTIKGRIGSHSVAHRDALGRIHYENVADTGIIAYIEATFEDGRLASYQKIDNDSGAGNRFAQP